MEAGDNKVIMKLELIPAFREVCNEGGKIYVIHQLEQPSLWLPLIIMSNDWPDTSLLGLRHTCCKPMQQMPLGSLKAVPLCLTVPEPSLREEDGGIFNIAKQPQLPPSVREILHILSISCIPDQGNILPASVFR